jgi:hypothetical protein
MKHFPVRVITELCQPRQQVAPVIRKPRHRKAWNVFKKYSRRSCLFDYAQSFWKKIPFIPRAQLLSSNRKRRTGHAPGQQVYPPKVCTPYRPHIRFNHSPFAAIRA